MPTAERWCHPAVVAGVVLVVAVTGAVGYAGLRAAAAVLYCLLLDGGIVVAWLAAAAGWGAWPVARLGRQRSPVLVAVTAVAGGLGIMGLLVLGLGLVGALNFSTAVGLLGVGWALGGTWLARRRKTALSEVDPGLTEAEADESVDGFWHPAWRWLWLLLAPPLAAALAAAMLPPGMLWKPEEPHGFDATAYHLQVPREWFEAGRIIPLQHNAFSYFPFGVEVHSLLAMHLKGGPWDAMYLAQLMHLAWVGLSVAAVYGVARHLTADRRAATVAAVAYATVPLLAQLGPLAFNEGGLLLFGTLAVGWALVGVREAWGNDEGGKMKDEGGRAAANDGGEPVGSPETVRSPVHLPGSSPVSSFILRPSSLRPFLLAGVMAGFACGVKLTGVPLFLVAVPAAAFAALFRRSSGSAFRGMAAIVVAGTVVFAPWLVRTAVWSGNPVFPEGTAVFGKAHFTDVQVERWNRAHAPQPEQQSAGARLAALGGQVAGNWQFGYLLLPAGVVALAARWRRRPEARVLALLLAVHAAFWLAMTHLQGRFFVPVLPLAAVGLALLPWGGLPSGRPGGSLGLAAFALCVGVAAVAGWWGVHGRLAGVLAGLQSDNGLDARSAILASENVDWLERDVWDVFPKDDPSATLTLVGDAQVFWYTLPMSRLRYRTPFDVPQGPEATVVEGYGANDRGPASWLRVAPAEVERFVKTYQPFPKVPDALGQSPAWRGEAPLPFVVPPGRSP